MSAPRTVVLVHGAWHGAWCFAALQDALDRRGVPSLAVDLPGHGASTAPLGDLFTDARHVADLLAVLADRRPGDPPVLVGHSYGGAVITEAAAHTAVHHLVYLAAFALDEGESVGSFMRAAPAADVLLDRCVTPAPDVDGRPSSTVLRPDEQTVRALYGRCDPAIGAAALARLSPQPVDTMRGRVSGAPRDTVPSTYVVCSDDLAVAPAHQRLMAQRCTHTVELDADHSPFLSAVDATADIIASIATALPASGA